SSRPALNRSEHDDYWHLMVSRTVKYLAWPCASVLAMVNHHDTVDEDIVDSVRSQVGLLVRRAILDLVVIENHRISPHALSNQSAVRNAHAGCGPGSHLADGVLQGKHVLFPHVASNDARKVAVTARVGET